MILVDLATSVVLLRIQPTVEMLVATFFVNDVLELVTFLVVLGLLEDSREEFLWFAPLWCFADDVETAVAATHTMDRAVN
ncbi:hypothetical protein COV18_02690 [Candidatus Woesearchaeota archaeon CG10_big_fil_rev_8_21_14_0_10_37_12]|nr:MAG: hypothetical protein COV18_02690 [Candidatus Woesearchaeota archaeon CG10_big_fil_rev_8_21_14_0_10_37_12]